MNGELITACGHSLTAVRCPALDASAAVILSVHGRPDGALHLCAVYTSAVPLAPPRAQAFQLLMTAAELLAWQKDLGLDGALHEFAPVFFEALGVRGGGRGRGRGGGGSGGGSGGGGDGSGGGSAGSGGGGDGVGGGEGGGSASSSLLASFAASAALSPPLPAPRLPVFLLGPAASSVGGSRTLIARLDLDGNPAELVLKAAPGEAAGREADAAEAALLAGLIAAQSEALLSMQAAAVGARGATAGEGGRAGAGALGSAGSSGVPARKAPQAAPAQLSAAHALRTAGAAGGGAKKSRLALG